ncbi:hypothetical protein [Streptacidiphilus fuscans]|uniref:Uncharacterized protein n=1 Tax=Streptacidiphilus fuscans TaxID=2789292 RepID=A0A931B8I2_9ACTN|nr:hypothetical protein [Streptacidiphilus fuscans]MBF9073165.1 hypothetical protein [Streptacidiphilus fuscans]
MTLPLPSDHGLRTPDLSNVWERRILVGRLHDSLTADPLDNALGDRASSQLAQ